MKLCLHIGQPKAASSSIQRALWDRRAPLAAAGVLYPNTPSKNHNSAVADFLLHGGASGGSRFRQELTDLGVPGLWQQLGEDVRAACHVIISSEFLINLTLPWIHRWMDGLGAGAATILLCVRRVSESLPSSYAQAAKTAPTLAFEPWLRSLFRMVEVWQSLLRSGRPVDPRLLQNANDVGCGRYALVPDVAALVDAAYPMAGEADSAARVELQARILHPEPMTTISVSGDEWEQGLRRCRAQLEAGFA